MHDNALSPPSTRPDLNGGRATLTLFLALALAFVVFGPAVLDLYAVNLLTRAFFVAIVAITVSILWGATGFLTFGQSAFFGIGAYVLAMTFTKFDFGPWQAALGFALAILAAGAVAGIVGWISFYPGSTPLYATVISLVLPIILVQVLYSGGELTGSSSGLVGFSTFDLDLGVWFRIAGVALIVVAVFAQMVLSSDAGRLLLAVRDNEARCAYLGIDTPKLRILLLVTCAMVAGAAGFGYAGFGGVAAPENASFVFGTQLVVAVALGGRGSPVAAAIGAVAIEFASAYLSGVLPFVWELFVGGAFILIILLLPQGLLGAILKRVSAPAKGCGLTEAGRGSPSAVTGGDMAVVCRNVSKSFGSLQVLRGVNLAAAPGELVSLVGPNGAGKSTLMKCLADGRERSGGDIAVFGRDIGRLPPDGVVRFGLGRKFQTASVFESLTVAECLRISRARFERPSIVWCAAELALPASALRIVEMSGLRDRLEVVARNLSHGLKQALELAMVMALEPRVVLLDEPTAGLTRNERRQIGAILQDLCSQDGICILLVEHDLAFVKDVSSRIVVLHQGRIVLDGPTGDVLSSPLIEEVYAGAHAPAAAETCS